MDPAETTPLDPSTLDQVDQAALSLGCPAFGVYLYLTIKRQQYQTTSFVCSDVREKLRIKETATLRKYLDMIHAVPLARIIYTPRGDAFLFEKLTVPGGSAVREKTALDRKNPPSTGISGSPTEPIFPAQSRLNRPSAEISGPGPFFSVVDSHKDFGVKGFGGVQSLKTPTPTTPAEVKILLGEKVIGLAAQYHSTITIPGHLWHAWLDSMKYDEKDPGQAVLRVTNAVLYVAQQKELGIKILNHVGYFFDAIKKARTPSKVPEKKQALERAIPREKTPEQVQKEKETYWQARTWEEIKDQFFILQKMGMGNMNHSSYRYFLEGVALSRFNADFTAWLLSNGSQEPEKGA